MTFIHQKTVEEKNKEFAEHLSLFCKRVIDKDKTYEEKLADLQTKFKEEVEKTKGEISTSMNVNTRPTHKLEYKGYYVMIDGKMPIEDFNELKEKLK